MSLPKTKGFCIFLGFWRLAFWSLNSPGSKWSFFDYLDGDFRLGAFVGYERK